MTDNLTPFDPYAESVDISEENSRPISFRITPFAIVIVLAAVLLVSVVGWGIYQSQQDTVKDGPAPDFSLALYSDENIPYDNADTYMDMAGETIQLSQFEGEKVVILNFWQSNCVPCHQEADMLVRLYNEYRDKGVVLIGINAKDPDKLAYEYMAQYNINYPNGLDRGDEIQEDYRTTGYPETFIIRRDGKIQKHFAGPPSENVLRAEIDKALES